MKNYGPCSVCSLDVIGYKNKARTTKRNCHMECLVAKETLPTCPICLDEVAKEESHCTPCGHTFHKGCIEKWKSTAHKNSHTCPSCRAHIAAPPSTRNDSLMGVVLDGIPEPQLEDFYEYLTRVLVFLRDNDVIV